MQWHYHDVVTRDIFFAWHHPVEWLSYRNPPVMDSVAEPTNRFYTVIRLLRKMNQKAISYGETSCNNGFSCCKCLETNAFPLYEVLKDTLSWLNSIISQAFLTDSLNIFILAGLYIPRHIISSLDSWVTCLQNMHDGYLMRDIMMDIPWQAMVSVLWKSCLYIESLVQDYSNSIANAMELL